MLQNARLKPPCDVYAHLLQHCDRRCCARVQASAATPHVCRCSPQRAQASLHPPQPRADVKGQLVLPNGEDKGVDSNKARVCCLTTLGRFLMLMLWEPGKLAARGAPCWPLLTLARPFCAWSN